MKNVRKLGVRVALAGWGYTNENQKEEAKQARITIIEKQEDIFRMLRILNI